MKSAPLALLVLALSMASAPSDAAPPPARPGDEAAIRAAIERLEAANNEGDVDAWVGLFADDFVYMPPGSPAVTSRDALADVAKAGFRNRADIEIVPVEIVVCGDWAFARSEVNGSVKLHTSGETIAISVKEILLLRNDGAKGWRVARLMVNGNR